MLLNVDDLTLPNEKKSVDVFNRMIIGIKKIINTHQNPVIKAKMKHLSTALMILQDETEKVGGNGLEVLTEIKIHLKEYYGIEINDIHIDALNEMFNEEIGE